MIVALSNLTSVCVVVGGKVVFGEGFCVVVVVVVVVVEVVVVGVVVVVVVYGATVQKRLFKD